MDFGGYISKTLNENRGYKWSNYKTKYKDNVFALFHYGTELLKVDFSTKKIISFYNCSISDRVSIAKCLNILNNRHLININAFTIGAELVAIEYNLWVPYFKLDEFRDKFNNLNIEQRELVRKIKDVDYYKRMDFMNLFIDKPFGEFEASFNKFAKHSDSIKEAIARYENAYNSMPDGKLIKLKKGYLLRLTKPPHFYHPTRYINEFKKEIKTLEFYLNTPVGRIYLTRKIKKKDLDKAKDVDIANLSRPEQRNLLEATSSLDKEFVGWLKRQIALSNL